VRQRADERARRAGEAHRLAVPAVDALRADAADPGGRELDPRSRAGVLGVAADASLAGAVVHGLGRGRPVLPADLQIAGMAMRELHVTSAAALAKIGGPSELESAWLHEACKATGNERSRCGCAPSSPPGPGAALRRPDRPADQPRADLRARGVRRAREPRRDHPRRRRRGDLDAAPRGADPAGQGADRARPGGGAPGVRPARLEDGDQGPAVARELFKLRSEGISAATPEEASVVQRSKRYYMAAAAAIAAMPLVILVLIWFAMRGQVHFALAPGPGGDHVVVRGGRAGCTRSSGCRAGSATRSPIPG